MSNTCTVSMHKCILYIFMYYNHFNMYLILLFRFNRLFVVVRKLISPNAYIFTIFVIHLVNVYSMISTLIICTYNIIMILCLKKKKNYYNNNNNKTNK